MTERELEILRFDKVNVSPEESGDLGYHYYTYDIVNGLSLISNDSEDAKINGWYVEFFNTEIPVRFHNMDKVLILINTLTKAIVDEKK
jgi:hypothetical protein